ncbi:MAG: hypothetical protein DI538_17090 [Azospira oryzae]|nr:MAG: hypothetical protein DI538_17090 [Azospira oryzae]
MLLLTACKDKPIPEVVPDDKLLAAFSQSPPVIEDLFMEKLEQEDEAGNTVVVTVKFSDQEKRLGGINAIPLTLDETTKVKLNDRGIAGDRTANDSIFSVALKVDENQMSAWMDNSNQKLVQKNNQVVTFSGRVAAVKEVNNFNAKSLIPKTKIPLPRFFVSSINATTLPDIREKSLMVRDISVVEDLTRTYDPCRTNKGNANGAWSFKTLITNMSGTLTAEEFLIDWVDHTLFSQQSLPSSSDATTNRVNSQARLIKAWMKNSGITPPATAGVPANWQTSGLKAEEFPVRLLAIVNRLDLRGNPGYGSGFNNAGEGRFVFSFVDSNDGCRNANNGPGTMTFILEYGIPITQCQALVDFGKQWWDLQSIAFGTDFNTRLENITNVFTAKNASPSRPNGSALNHFRTNDFLSSTISLADPWDIHDAEIDAATHKLKLIHPNREPMEAANGFATVTVNATKLAALVAFANSLPFSAANPNPSYDIPDDLKGIRAPMRVSPADQYHWRGDASNIIASFKRREFSFNSCSGCHKGETKTVFTHVKQRNLNAKAELSGFMTGLGTDDDPTDDDSDPMGSFWVNDPAAAEPPRAFNDAKFRATSLEELVFDSPCIKIPRFPNDLLAVERVLRFRPLNMPH